VSALLDVNTLVALAWPNHVHHRAAVRWFEEHSAVGWATCPTTESGFVRVSSNRKAIPTATTVSSAIAVLDELRSQPAHEFWVDDISLTSCPELDVTALAGYRQVADAHLLTLAIRRGGRLITFDRAVGALTPDRRSVEVLSI
jgi:toxin-antitoxin system PIN domain toxin